jgi:hypothetical protein
MMHGQQNIKSAYASKPLSVEIPIYISKPLNLTIPNNLIPVILTVYTAYENGTDRVFRNLGTYNSGTRESPNINNTKFTTR